jgi:hypothetical protein
VVTQYKGAASEQCKDMRMGRVATMCKDALVRARDPEGISKYKRSAKGSILMPNKTVVWPNTGEPLVRIISGFDLTVTRAVRAQHSKTEHTKKEGEKEDEKEGEKEGEEEETVDEVLLLQVKPTQEEFCYQHRFEHEKRVRVLHVGEPEPSSRHNHPQVTWWHTRALSTQSSRNTTR